MSSPAILNAGQHDSHLLAATKDVKDDNLVIDHWVPIINVHDHHVQEAAKFAVAEHNKKEKDDLIYVRVVSGATKSMIGGMYYRLIIEANRGHLLPPQEGLYEAMVWEGMTNPTSMKLEYFIPILKN